MKDLLTKVRCIYEEKKHVLRKKEVLLVSFALLCGLLSFVVHSISDRAVLDAQGNSKLLVEVVVAARDLSMGDALDAAGLTTAYVSEERLTKNYVLASKKASVKGYKIAVALAKGDPILLSMVEGHSAGERISETIPLGKRLFTLTIRDQGTIHGFMKPNDHVDVLAHMQIEDRGLTTFTLLQDVTLVSVGSRSSELDPFTEATDVSFYVDAKDAELLGYTQRMGNFSLSLRNPGDQSKRVHARGVSQQEFLNHDRIDDASGGTPLQIIERDRRQAKARE